MNVKQRVLGVRYKLVRIQTWFKVLPEKGAQLGKREGDFIEGNATPFLILYIDLNATSHSTSLSYSMKSAPNWCHWRKLDKISLVCTPWAYKGTSFLNLTDLYLSSHMRMSLRHPIDGFTSVWRFGQIFTNAECRPWLKYSALPLNCK